ncbi:acetolactate synthase small subunit [Deltaproteobacteria bacterium]|nr:acetolactate synthase small subunit [Deltaproteobacteria bacterium]GHV52504.1 acetolactate synthase small subunit [Deltaproteobacteria bacterium]
MRRVLSVLVDDEPGVLARIAALFSGRNYNIESISASPTQDPTTAHITIVTKGDEIVFEQIVKQLRRLICVYKVVDLTGADYVQRGLVLIKVHTEESKRGEILRFAEIFRCKVVDVSLGDLTLEVTGDYSKIQAIIQLLQHFGIREMSYGATIAMRRSMQDNQKNKSLRVKNLNREQL